MSSKPEYYEYEALEQIGRRYKKGDIFGRRVDHNEIAYLEDVGKDKVVPMLANLNNKKMFKRLRRISEEEYIKGIKERGKM